MKHTKRLAIFAIFLLLLAGCSASQSKRHVAKTSNSYKESRETKKNTKSTAKIPGEYGEDGKQTLKDLMAIKGSVKVPKTLVGTYRGTKGQYQEGEGKFDKPSSNNDLTVQIHRNGTWVAVRKVYSPIHIGIGLHKNVKIKRVTKTQVMSQIIYEAGTIVNVYGQLYIKPGTHFAVDYSPESQFTLKKPLITSIDSDSSALNSSKQKLVFNGNHQLVAKFVNTDSQENSQNCEYPLSKAASQKIDLISTYQQLTNGNTDTNSHISITSAESLLELIKVNFPGLMNPDQQGDGTAGEGNTDDDSKETGGEFEDSRKYNLDDTMDPFDAFVVNPKKLHGIDSKGAEVTMDYAVGIYDFTAFGTKTADNATVIGYKKKHLWMLMSQHDANESDQQNDVVPTIFPYKTKQGAWVELPKIADDYEVTGNFKVYGIDD